MAMLVHLADERDARRIGRSGIKGRRWELAAEPGPIRVRAAVFAMPVLPDYYASHQWLRELKRSGARTIIGVYFRVRADARVLVGHYNQSHRLLPLGAAIGHIMGAKDPRGFQIVVPLSIDAGAIHAIREVPQVVGWRYFPQSHERGPWTCRCAFCATMSRGEIKGSRLRRALMARYGPVETEGP